MSRQTTRPTPKQILANWAEENEFYPAKLAKALRCTPAHAWEILRGERPISLETLARLLIFLGPDGPAPAMADAMRADYERDTAPNTENAK